MRVNCRSDGIIPYGEPVVVESKPKQSFFRETLDVSLDIISIVALKLGNPKALATSVLAAKITKHVEALKYHLSEIKPLSVR